MRRICRNAPHDVLVPLPIRYSKELEDLLRLPWHPSKLQLDALVSQMLLALHEDPDAGGVDELEFAEVQDQPARSAAVARSRSPRSAKVIDLAPAATSIVRLTATTLPVS